MWRLMTPCISDLDLKDPLIEITVEISGMKAEVESEKEILKEEVPTLISDLGISMIEMTRTCIEEDQLEEMCIVEVEPEKVTGDLALNPGLGANLPKRDLSEVEVCIETIAQAEDSGIDQPAEVEAVRGKNMRSQISYFKRLKLKCVKTQKQLKVECPQQLQCKCSMIK